jgi:Zn-dependent protease with chaperone function
MPLRRISHALLLIFLSAAPNTFFRWNAISAQEAPTVRTSPPQQAEPPASSQVTPSGTETERYTLSHERYEKAIAYSRAGYALYFLYSIVGFVALALALRYGLVARLRDFAQRTTENRLLQGLLFVPLVLALLDLAELPVSISWHALSLHYDQSVQRWGSWLLDWCKSQFLELLFLTLLALILFFVIRTSPRRWWLYFWLASLPIILSIFYLEPVVIDPLFYKFELLINRHPQLANDLQKLTDRAGLLIPRERMFLMNASSKTNRLNAYVAGFGASKRVVIYDTVIQKMTPQETLFIFAHESGHFVLNHLRDSFLFLAVFLFFSMYAGYRLLHRFLDVWGVRCKIYGPRDWAALAVLLLLLQGIMFFWSPVMNGFSRMQEHNADIFGLELIHGIVPNASQVAAHAFQALGENDLADPNPPPFITFWMYSHPPLAQRLVFAHSYDPWGKKQQPIYVDVPK